MVKSGKKIKNKSNFTQSKLVKRGSEGINFSFRFQLVIWIRFLAADILDTIVFWV